jgi:hypothetical protein
MERYFEVQEETNWYQFQASDDTEPKKQLPVPTDELLRNLLQKNQKWIHNFSEIESLLQIDENLNEEEKVLARQEEASLAIPTKTEQKRKPGRKRKDPGEVMDKDLFDKLQKDFPQKTVKEVQDLLKKVRKSQQEENATPCGPYRVPFRPDLELSERRRKGQLDLEKNKCGFSKVTDGSSSPRTHISMVESPQRGPSRLCTISDVDTPAPSVPSTSAPAPASRQIPQVPNSDEGGSGVDVKKTASRKTTRFGPPLPLTQQVESQHVLLSENRNGNGPTGTVTGESSTALTVQRQGDEEKEASRNYGLASESTWAEPRSTSKSSASASSSRMMNTVEFPAGFTVESSQQSDSLTYELHKLYL